MNGGIASPRHCQPHSLTRPRDSARMIKHQKTRLTQRSQARLLLTYLRRSPRHKGSALAYFGETMINNSDKVKSLTSKSARRAQTSPRVQSRERSRASSKGLATSKASVAQACQSSTLVLYTDGTRICSTRCQRTTLSGEYRIITERGKGPSFSFQTPTLAPFHTSISVDLVYVDAGSCYSGATGAPALSYVIAQISLPGRKKVNPEARSPACALVGPRMGKNPAP